MYGLTHASHPSKNKRQKGTKGMSYGENCDQVIRTLTVLKGLQQADLQVGNCVNMPKEAVYGVTRWYSFVPYRRKVKLFSLLFCSVRNKKISRNII